METPLDYRNARFAYRRAAEAAPDAQGEVHPVVVVGAGPTGLAAAIDLAQRGISVVLVDDDDRLSVGSRAICFSKRSLEIFDRLRCGEAMTGKGVRWHVGKVFFRDELVYPFDLLRESGYRRPAFINLQQYYVEGYLLERALQLPTLEIRWKSLVVDIETPPAGRDEAGGNDREPTVLTIETPEGRYDIRAHFVVAADGARSALRKRLGCDSHGRTFKDRFLIADVKMEADFPPERWFWFDPPFHRNQSVLLHRQPDNVWRIDFQLGWDADPEREKEPERVLARVRALLGEDAQFSLEWVSVYTFSCSRMSSFRCGNVIFAGDSAHCVSPFGARGANSGLQDADNLGWKLEFVLRGLAPDALIDSYAREREYAADENIRHSTRSTDFITPKTAMSRVFRDAVLTLARHHPFARQLVNSGRLSVPAVLADSPLNTADRDRFSAGPVPGSVTADAPVDRNNQADWLLSHLGETFSLLLFGGANGLGDNAQALFAASQRCRVSVRNVAVLPAGARVNNAAESAAVTLLFDREGLAAERYDATPGTAYLIRPDQHVCARWRSAAAADLEAAVARALCVKTD